MGEHGWFDKRFIYDESFKTPLLIRWPNKIEPGITSDEMVQNLDFAQTFLEAAMINIPDDMQGESLMPLLTGNNEKWDREEVYYHYYEYPSVHMVKRHYGIVSKNYNLIKKKKTIAIAGGEKKASAIKSILLNGCLHGLITDEEAARNILK